MNTIKDIYSSLIISLKADTSVVFPASQPRGQSRDGGKEKTNPNKINICEFLNRLDCITMLNVCDGNSGVGCVLCVGVCGTFCATGSKGLLCSSLIKKKNPQKSRSLKQSM